MEWQPIDTAPRDGTPILGFDPVRGNITTVSWLQSNGADDGYWNLCVCGAFADDGEWNPMYWMPLPEPPKQ